MSKGLDKELYVKQEDIEEYLKALEYSVRIHHISTAENFTNYINNVLEAKLTTFNDKCSTCVKKDVCKGRDVLAEASYSSGVTFKVGVINCHNYLKEKK